MYSKKDQSRPKTACMTSENRENYEHCLDKRKGLQYDEQVCALKTV